MPVLNLFFIVILIIGIVIFTWMVWEMKNIDKVDKFRISDQHYLYLREAVVRHDDRTDYSPNSVVLCATELIRHQKKEIEQLKKRLEDLTSEEETYESFKQLISDNLISVETKDKMFKWINDYVSKKIPTEEDA